VIWVLVLIWFEKRLRPAGGIARLGVFKRAGLFLASLLVSLLVITYNTVPFTLRKLPW
jgi:hypothetical protein